MMFTMTYLANTHPRTTVLIQNFADLPEATAHALACIESAANNATRVLIRVGDDGPTSPVVWDSANQSSHERLNRAIINRVDNMLSDMATMHTRMLALKEDIHNLLGTKP